MEMKKKEERDQEETRSPVWEKEWEENPDAQHGIKKWSNVQGTTVIVKIKYLLCVPLVKGEGFEPPRILSPQILFRC